MRAAVAIGQQPTWQDALAEATSQMPIVPSGETIDLAFLFASSDYRVVLCQKERPGVAPTGLAVQGGLPEGTPMNLATAGILAMMLSFVAFIAAATW